MKELSETQLLGLEQKMYHDHSQLLSNIARNLRSAARSCDLMAKDLERESLCARRTAALKKIRPQGSPTSATEQNGRGQIEKIEQRIVKGAMRAANALKQNQIINDAVQSLIAPAMDEHSATPKIDQISKLSEDTLHQISPDDISTFICYLAAEILVDRELLEGSGPPNEKGGWDIHGQSPHDGNDSEDHGISSSLMQESFTEEIKADCPQVTQRGFVTASGWIAINRRRC